MIPWFLHYLGRFGLLLYDAFSKDGFIGLTAARPVSHSIDKHCLLLMNVTRGVVVLKMVTNQWQVFEATSNYENILRLGKQGLLLLDYQDEAEYQFSTKWLQSTRTETSFQGKIVVWISKCISNIDLL